MALQGTLDTFALPDVLRLLASTAKTGRLRVTGDRGSGAVWFQDGRLGGAALGDDIGPREPDEVLLQLLRSTEGSFVFDAGVALEPADGHDGEGHEVDDVLARVEVLLAEWREIEAMVPSPESWLSLVADLGAVDGGVDAVTVDAGSWSLIVAIGSGSSVDGLLDAVPGDELALLRALKDLVERGLVEVGEPRDLSGVPSYGAGVIDQPAGFAPPVAAEHDVASDAVRALEAAFTARHDEVVPRPSLHELNGLSTVGLSHERAAVDTGRTSLLGGLVEQEPERSDGAALAPVPRPGPSTPPSGAYAYGTTGFDSAGFDSAGFDTQAPRAQDDAYGSAVVPGSLSYDLDDHGGGLTSDPDEAAEIARQLASLSPRAAKAVAAAAKAPTVEEREAALAAIEAEDETVNRGLLLKFLGSVDQ